MGTSVLPVQLTAFEIQRALDVAYGVDSIGDVVERTSLADGPQGSQSRISTVSLGGLHNVACHPKAGQ